MKDLVVGLATGYTWDQIEPWAVSLLRTGYNGVKGVVLDNSSPDLSALTDKVESLGFTVFQIGSWDRPFLGRRRTPHDEKFNLVADILEAQHFRFVVMTDLRDLIFQTNPITWLEENLSLEANIAVSTESCLHRDSDWLMDNLQQSFGADAAAQMSGQEVFNSGVIAGQAFYLLPFFRAVYEKCCESPCGLPDQAAMNILIRQEPWKSQVQLNSVASGMAIHARTGARTPGRLEKEEPVWTESGLTIDGKLICMVHQYGHYSGGLGSKYREANCG